MGTTFACDIAGPPLCLYDGKERLPVTSSTDLPVPSPLRRFLVKSSFDKTQLHPCRKWYGRYAVLFVEETFADLNQSGYFGGGDFIKRTKAKTDDPQIGRSGLFFER
jgi:hypothetical protein